MHFCSKCSSKLQKILTEYFCPKCDKEKFELEKVEFFPSPIHATKYSWIWDKHFKNITEVARISATLNSDIVVSVATRFTFEKVAT